MIRHIVMWKFKPVAEGATKEENLRKVKALLEALPETVPLIRRMEVHLNENPNPKNYDAVLISEFDSLDDLAAYTKHPAHQKISSFVALCREGRASADYTF
ncbi:MAG TPA: Dabb family protein [Candidatus Fimivicinus intestinavium]|nr:Dabb family protein [Candidatus Fimivicinus intestinavium]